MVTTYEQAAETENLAQKKIKIKKNQPEGTKKYISCKGPKTKTKLDGVKKPVIL